MKLKKWCVFAAAAVCVIAAVCLELVSRSMTGRLLHQTAAERYMCEEGQPYKQISVFFSADNRLSVSAVAEAETSITQELQENSVMAYNSDSRLWYDAWSTEKGIVKADGMKASGVECTASLVGGDFFEIHAMHILSGSYIRPDDLMADRVVIDTLTAWKTFGSAEIAGMEITIDGKPYMIAAVVEPEQDRTTQSVYGAKGRIWMPYPKNRSVQEEKDAFVSPEAEISCYEAVLPNPVRNFASERINKAFTSQEDKQILINTDRDTIAARFDRFWHLRRMAVTENSLTYPWWENSARLRDFTAAQLFGVEMLLLVFPVLSLIAGIWKLYQFLTAFVRRKIRAHKRRYRTIGNDPITP